jgi:hypothetical protein
MPTNRWMGPVGALIVLGSGCGEVVTPTPDGAGGIGGDPAGGSVGDGGAGAQGAGGSEEQPMCPPAPPESHTACDEFGQTCEWGAGECLHEAKCMAGGWQVTTSGSCDCPVTVPMDGSHCEIAGLICAYAAPGACNSNFHATCVETSWSVLSDAPGCDFTCPEWPDEDFLQSPCDPCCHHPCMGGEQCSYYFATCVGGTWEDSYTPC